MTCSPAPRRSGRRSASRPVGRERRAGGAMTSTPSTCSRASSFLTPRGLGATSATWTSSAGTRPLTSPAAQPVWRGEGARRTPPGEDYFASQCWNAWRDFGHQTGTRLWAERAGWRRELRTAEQTLAFLRGFTWQNRGYGQGLAVSAAGRSFTFARGSPVRGTGGITSFTNATGSNLADLGRVRRVPLIVTRREFPMRVVHRVPAGHGEGLRRTRGEAAGTQPASSSAERTSDAGVALARTELRLC